MSTITSILLQFDGLAFAHTDDPDGDGDLLPQVQAIVRGMTACLEFKSITNPPADWYWGGLVPECDLLAGAFNCFDLDEFFEELEKLQWTHPGAIRVFVQREHSRAFGVWVMRDGKMVCVLEEVPW